MISKFTAIKTKKGGISYDNQKIITIKINEGNNKIQ